MSKLSYIVLLIGSFVIAAWLGLIASFNGFGGAPAHFEGYLAGVGAILALCLGVYCIVKLASGKGKTNE
jgi:hypothetical protein